MINLITLSALYYGCIHTIMSIVMEFTQLYVVALLIYCQTNMTLKYINCLEKHGVINRALKKN